MQLVGEVELGGVVVTQSFGRWRAFILNAGSGARPTFCMTHDSAAAWQSRGYGNFDTEENRHTLLRSSWK